MNAGLLALTIAFVLGVAALRSGSARRRSTVRAAEVDRAESVDGGHAPALMVVRDDDETARLLPRGDDGGFAEKFLEARQRSRHIRDT